MIFSNTLKKIKYQFFDNRLHFSKKKNFLDALMILFTSYSMVLFFFLFLNLQTFHLQNLTDFLLYYILFVFVLPLIISLKHSFIYSSLIEVYKSSLKNNIKENNITEKKSFTDNLEQEELKLSQLFKKN